MGRHLRVLGSLLAVVVLAAACGLGPADDPLVGADADDCPDVVTASPEPLEVGVIIERADEGADHVLCEVAYETGPPTSGAHFPVWQNCGFYTEPIRNETAVHALEHGAIWIAYDPDLDPVLVDEISAVTALDPHFISSPYPGLQNPIVLSAWQRQLAVDRIGDNIVVEFMDTQLGRVSETAPEAGASCEGGVGAPPFDPDRGFDDAVAFFAEG